MSENSLDLAAVQLDLETLEDGNALGCFASASCASSASCPASTASSFTTASTYS